MSKIFKKGRKKTIDQNKYSISILEKENELSELQKFKEFIINCFEAYTKEGYVVDYLTIDLMSYTYWQKHFINNTTPSLRKIHLDYSSVIPDTSIKNHLTLTEKKYGIFITPSFQNADRNTERKHSKEVPITSILSNVDFLFFSNNLWYLSRLIEKYGKENKKAFWYLDSGSSSRIYFLDELLKIQIHDISCSNNIERIINITMLME